jgi:hypothetical protein
MTYDQYQQLYGEAKEQIAARVAKIQPRAGNGASVNGMGITVEVPVAEEVLQPEDDRWALHLFANVNDIGMDYCGSVSRVDPTFFIRTAFWERTQLFDIPPTPPSFDPPSPGTPRQYEAKNIYFWARAIEDYKVRATRFEPSATYARRLFDQSYYRIPVRLKIVQYNLRESSRPNQEEIVATHTLDLRREGQGQLFRPIGSDVFQYLDFESLELL